MQLLSASEAVLWTQRIIGAALVLQTVELIQLRHAFGDEGVWRWKDLRADFEGFPRPLLGFFDRALGYRGFLGLLALRLCAALLILAFPHPVLFGVLLIGTLLISLRWRGSFNGGSDFMTLIVLSALTVSSLFPPGATIQRGCLWYVAIQSCTSYFVSGWIKVRRANWRSGRALQGFLSATIHPTLPIARRLIATPLLALAASWLTLAFECSFPLALLNTGASAAYIGMALLFHLSCFYAFGLNRFAFAWASTYPALYYCSQAIRI